MAEPASLESLLAHVGRGFTGRAEEAAAVFADDAVFVDHLGEPARNGRAAIADYFRSFGGRGEEFRVRDVLHDGERAALEYTVVYHADPHAWAHRGIALVAMADGLITSWRGLWTEAGEDPDDWDSEPALPLDDTLT